MRSVWTTRQRVSPTTRWSRAHPSRIARRTGRAVRHRRRAGTGGVRRRRDTGRDRRPRRHRIARSHRRPAARHAEHDARRQRALPGRGAHAAGRLSRPRPPLERTRRGPVRRGRAARARRARALAAARPYARPRAHRHRARPPSELARHHAAELAPPGFGRHLDRRARRPGHHPGRRPGHADPGFLEHPVREWRSDRRRRAPLLGAVLARVTGTTPPAPLRYDDALGEWWSAQGTRGALDRAAQWRAAVALGLLDQDPTP